MSLLVAQVALIRAGQRGGLQKGAFDWGGLVAGKRPVNYASGTSVTQHGLAQPGYQTMKEPITGQVLHEAPVAPGTLNANLGSAYRYASPEAYRTSKAQEKLQPVNQMIPAEAKREGVGVDINVARDQGAGPAMAGAVGKGLGYLQNKVVPGMVQPIIDKATGQIKQQVSDMAGEYWKKFQPFLYGGLGLAAASAAGSIGSWLKPDAYQAGYTAGAPSAAQRQVVSGTRSGVYG